MNIIAISVSIQVIFIKGLIWSYLYTGLQQVVEIVSSAYHSNGLSSCSVCSVNHYIVKTHCYVLIPNGGGGVQMHQLVSGVT